jgi:hypothetical protein
LANAKRGKVLKGRLSWTEKMVADVSAKSSESCELNVCSLTTGDSLLNKMRVLMNLWNKQAGNKLSLVAQTLLAWREPLYKWIHSKLNDTQFCHTNGCNLSSQRTPLLIWNWQSHFVLMYPCMLRFLYWNKKVKRFMQMQICNLYLMWLVWLSDQFV